MNSPLRFFSLTASCCPHILPKELAQRTCFPRVSYSSQLSPGPHELEVRRPCCLWPRGCAWWATGQEGWPSAYGNTPTFRQTHTRLPLSISPIYTQTHEHGCHNSRMCIAHRHAHSCPLALTTDSPSTHLLSLLHSLQTTPPTHTSMSGKLGPGTRSSVFTLSLLFDLKQG